MGGQTDIGGCQDEFQTTDWAEVLCARTHDDSRRRRVMNTLFTRYWRPVYSYLRRKGEDNETAKDLTQGFFCEVVLGRDLIGQATPSKGRLRNLLLTALGRYVTDQRRIESARKRVPSSGLVSLEALGAEDIPDARLPADPNDAFVHAWAVEMLNEALDELKREYVGTGKDAHWSVFHARLIAPAVGQAEPVPFQALCERLGCDERKAYNMLASVKRRFQALLRGRIRQSLRGGKDVDQQEIDGEIDDLIEGLLKGPA